MLTKPPLSFNYPNSGVTHLPRCFVVGISVETRSYLCFFENVAFNSFLPENVLSSCLLLLRGPGRGDDPSKNFIKILTGLED